MLNYNKLAALQWNIKLFSDIDICVAFQELTNNK